MTDLKHCLRVTFVSTAVHSRATENEMHTKILVYSDDAILLLTRRQILEREGGVAYSQRWNSRTQ